MTRRATLLFILSALFVMLAMPVAAQDGATAEPVGTSPPATTMEPEASVAPTLPPFPTPIPGSDGPVVQGVFFFSPTCGHCEYVITQVLPGLFADNGGDYVITFDQTVLPEQPAFYLMSNGQLQLLMVDTSVAEGGAMFEADSVRLELDRAGVPRLDIEGDYLVGSGDIPDQFPDIVKQGLAGSGIAWPAVPGLGEAIASFIAEGSVIDPEAESTVPPAEPSEAPSEPTEAPAEATAEPAEPTEGATQAPSDATEAPAEATAEPAEPTAEPTEETSTPPTEEATAAPDGEDDDAAAAVLPLGGDDEDVLDKISNDAVGNGVSIVVLILLVVSLFAAPFLASRDSLPTFPSWLVIVLSVIGIGVAAYLASIETTGSEAVCGPVGDCNAVQESEFAEFLGIPIGVLGVIGYLIISGLWVVAQVAKGRAADWAILLIAVGAFAGSLFSAYLTFLEPFVIGATCMWCITSALVMVALLWVSAGPGWAAYQRLRGQSGPEAAASS